MPQVATTIETVVAATVETAAGTSEENTQSTTADATTSDAAAATGSNNRRTSDCQPSPAADQHGRAHGRGRQSRRRPAISANVAATPDGSDGNPITSGVDRVRFVQRVARAFQSVGSSGGSVRLRLSPPELGSVRLEVSVKNGVLTAHAQTETAQARDALIDNLPALRERLAEQNIQVDQFDVDLFDSSGGGTSSQSQGNGDRSPGFTPTAGRSTEQADDRARRAQPPATAKSGGEWSTADSTL